MSQFEATCAAAALDIDILELADAAAQETVVATAWKLALKDKTNREITIGQCCSSHCLRTRRKLECIGGRTQKNHSAKERGTMKGWIKVTCVYPKVHGRPPKDETEVQAKEMHIRSDRITDVSDGRADEFPMGNSVVALGVPGQGYMVTESVDEIMVLIERADA